MLKNYPENTLQTVLQSISAGTLRQYNSTYKLWWVFCQKHNFSVYKSGVSEVLQFLQDLLDTQSIQYGTFNAHRSALSLILSTDIANDARIKRFLKGVGNIRPTAPRYNHVWDTQPVIAYLKNMFPNTGLTLRDLSMKLASFLVLITGQRVQTISLIKIGNICNSAEGYQIFIPDKIKTSGPGKPQPCLHVPFFTEEPSLCVGSVLKFYLEITAKIRRSDQQNLFLVTRPPYQCASKQTISKWVKELLGRAGVNTEEFRAHSTRHASTSAARRKGISLDLIRQTAGWSKDSSTFARFYNRPIIDSFAFAKSVLNL